MRLYRISGMTVASEIELPGAWPLDSGEPDIVMRQGRVARTLANSLGSTLLWDADGDHFLLRGRGVGRFLLSDGREVIFEPEYGVPAARCAGFLQGMVIGMLLNQRGGIALHASAVAVSGKAVLFCGASGEGKSTLAAAVSMRGRGMISDDVSSITFDRAGHPFVSADGRQLKLTNSSIDALHLNARRREAVLEKSDKTYVSPPVRWTGADLPVGAIYLLRSRAGSPDSITPLESAAALQELNRNAYRPGLIRRTGHAPRYFAASLRIVQQASVFTYNRERELARLPELASALERHWQQIGLG
jgi:hypothetical protein